MIIEAEIKNVIVTIDDVDYPVIPKTIASAETLQKLEEAYKDRPTYLFWLAQLEVFLGKDAVKRLFPYGKKENLDRMELIYYGVWAAFDANGRDKRANRYAQSLSEVSALVESLKPVTELIQTMQAQQGIVLPTQG